MLLIQLLTVAHVFIHIDNISETLKYCNFKTSKNPRKTEKFEISILYILKERPTVQQNLLLLQIYTHVQ